MNEEDLKAVLAKYQQKTFELYNQNIVLETQVERLGTTVSLLQQEIEKLQQEIEKTPTKTKRIVKSDDEF